MGFSPKLKKLLTYLPFGIYYWVMNVENTRDEILAVACRLFAQKGYDAVGVQQIAELSKITKPTLYYYFGSKIGILRALIQEKGALLYECLEAVCVDRHDFFNSVQDIIRAEIDFARREPDFFRLHRALLDAPEDSEYFEEYSEMREKLKAVLLDFFIKSSEIFGNMRSKEKLYSTLFHSEIISVAENVLRGVISDDDDTIYKITHSFIYGFAD